ncbi:MAG: UDP-N-acetylmuramate dehydrogenase [Candidatus Nanopelagicales bacterium]
MSTRPALAELTTFRIGGPIDSLIVATTELELIEAVRAADASDTPVLLIGGGSNLLCSDSGFAGTVIAIRTRGVEVVETGASVRLTVAAGESWDSLVARAVGHGWSGIEALSGIPGLVGATPVQNVGAYGQDISNVIREVRAWDRRHSSLVTLTSAQCEFGYRSSLFKCESSRFVVLEVIIELTRGDRGSVEYSQLARQLDVNVGDELPLARIRDAVLSLRREKGMVLDVDDTDTWSAGSFFTNPIVDAVTAATVPSECPRYPSESGVKLSAAWLIENAGIERGFRVSADARARVSTKHTLALTNTGGATAADMRELADVIRRRVLEVFGIELVPEPKLAGF